MWSAQSVPLLPPACRLDLTRVTKWLPPPQSGLGFTLLHSSSCFLFLFPTLSSLFSFPRQHLPRERNCGHPGPKGAAWRVWPCLPDLSFRGSIGEQASRLNCLWTRRRKRETPRLQERAAISHQGEKKKRNWSDSRRSKKAHTAQISPEFNKGQSLESGRQMHCCWPSFLPCSCPWVGRKVSRQAYGVEA